MKRAVLISIQPKWCALIANRKKTIEVRKSCPNLKPPFKCYIYCTKTGRPLIYGDRPSNGGWVEEFCQTYGYSREEAERIWGVFNGKVIGEFTCDRVYSIVPDENGWGEEYGYSEHDCLSDSEMYEYLGDRTGFGWRISDLKIYDEPKKLEEFRLWNTTYDFLCGYPVPSRAIKRPPQSWCYVEGPMQYE